MLRARIPYDNKEYWLEPEELPAFKKAYNKAVKEEKENFTYTTLTTQEEIPILTAFGKYVIMYMDGNY